MTKKETNIIFLQQFTLVKQVYKNSGNALFKGIIRCFR